MTADYPPLNLPHVRWCICRHRNAEHPDGQCDHCGCDAFREKVR